MRRLWALLPALALVASCELPRELEATSSATPTPTTATTPRPTTPNPTPTTTPGALAGIEISAEHHGGYDREAWPHWRTEDGCDTRERVLKAQGSNVRVDEDCDIVSGTWTSPYDGQVWHDASDLDIDHIVALAEAYQSGGHAWDEDARTAYANDEGLLLAVTDNVNQSKSAQDPSTWLPELHRCRYVEHWIRIKRDYDLSMDTAEKAAIRDVLEGC